MNTNGISTPIYLDNNATTPCDPRVLEKMLPFFTEVYGNPANGYHKQGRDAAKAIDIAREQVASLIGAQPYEIIFTAGATESNNLAILGTARIHSNNSRRVIVTSKIEHKAVLNPFKKLSSERFDPVIVSVDRSGVIDIGESKRAISSETLLVSIHLANNEIGTIQPIKEITKLAHQVGAIVHCDAAQGVGKIPVDVEELDVDLLSLSAHKFYGPKGIGALYIRGGTRQIPLEPLTYGGGQENDIRSGTSNVPGIVGLGEAASICQRELIGDGKRIRILRGMLEEGLGSVIPDLKVNALGATRLPNTSSLTFPDVDADVLLLNLPEMMLGTGSACNSGAMEPSHVLESIGLSRDAAHRTIRASLGRFTIKDQIDYAIEKIAAAYAAVS